MAHETSLPEIKIREYRRRSGRFQWPLPTSGNLMSKGVNVIYQVVDWDFARKAAKDVAMREFRPDAESVLDPTAPVGKAVSNRRFICRRKHPDRSHSRTTCESIQTICAIWAADRGPTGNSRIQWFCWSWERNRKARDLSSSYKNEHVA
jgi:hypothetical protein